MSVTKEAFVQTIRITCTCWLVPGVVCASDSICCGWLQYLETLDEMESIGNTAAQQTALSGSTNVDESDVTSNGTMLNNVQYVEAGKPAAQANSSQAPAAYGTKSTSSASNGRKVQPLGYRLASCLCAYPFMHVIASSRNLL